MPSVKATWPVPDSDGGSPRTAYHLRRRQYADGVAGDWSEIAMLGPAVQEYTDNTPLANTTYGYAVAASNYDAAKPGTGIATYSDEVRVTLGAAINHSANAPLPPADWNTTATAIDATAGGEHWLRNDTDYVVTAQRVGVATRLRGGRHVTVYAAESYVEHANWEFESESLTAGLSLEEYPITDPADPDYSGEPAADRIFHIEGVRIHGPNLSQGLRLNCPTALVRIVNVNAGPVRFANSDHRDGDRGRTTNHPDLLQPYSQSTQNAKAVEFYGFTGESMYQGLFFADDSTVAFPVHMEHVNARAVKLTGNDGIAYAGHIQLWNENLHPITAVGNTVHIEGHPDSGWAAAGDGSRTFRKVRYWVQTAPPGEAYTTAITHHTFDVDLETWVGASTTLEHVADAAGSQSGGGYARFSNAALPATGDGHLRGYSGGSVSRDISANGPMMAVWVRLPSGTPGHTWRVRLGLYKMTDTGSGTLLEQTEADATPITAGGGWTLCTWTPSDTAFLTDNRRLGVRITGKDVNGAASAEMDTYTQGSASTTPEEGYYQDDPVLGTATHVDAVRYGAATHPTASTDAEGEYVTMPDLTGVIRLGPPPGGDYVPASLVGTGYVRPQ